jgi:hypothetical protein
MEDADTMMFLVCTQNARDYMEKIPLPQAMQGNRI